MKDPSKVAGAYRRCLNTAEGSVVLNDLRNFCKIDEQNGCALEYAEYAYRSGMQDMFRYIEALSSDE